MTSSQRFCNILNSAKKLNSWCLCTLADDGFLTEMENMLPSISLNPFLTFTIPAHIQPFFWRQIISFADIHQQLQLPSHNVSNTALLLPQTTSYKPTKMFWTLHCATNDVHTPSQQYGGAEELSTQSSCDTQHVPHSGTWHSKICSRR